jgi:hypothetical protein
MKTDQQYAEEFAIKQFLIRAKKALESGQIDNSSLIVGSDMYFYCEHCGIECDRLPEDYLFPPHRRCSQCEGLQEMCLIGEAKKALIEETSRGQDVAT